MEIPKLHKQDVGINQDAGKVEKEHIIEGVVFGEITKKDGSKEFRSSAPDRKIMILKTFSQIPEAGKSYRVRVIEDTKPEDPMEGKMIVEITLDPEQEKKVIDLAKQIKDLFAKNKLQEALELLKGIQTELSLETSKEDNVEICNRITNILKEFLEKNAAPVSVIAAGLSGIGTPESMVMRRELISKGHPMPVVKSLTGVGTPESMDLRREYINDNESGWRNLIAKSLAGVGTPESMIMRKELIEKGADKNAIAEGLAGISTPESMAMRYELFNLKDVDSASVVRGLAGVSNSESMMTRKELIGFATDDVAKSLIGVGTPESMIMRNQLINNSGVAKHLIVKSLAGVGTSESMLMREEFIKEGLRGPVAESLAGVDTPESMTMRKELFEFGGGKYEYSIALGLAGVATKEAFEFRDKYFVNNMAWYASSFCSSDSYNDMIADAIVCKYGFEK